LASPNYSAQKEKKVITKKLGEAREKAYIDVY
jgi:hypothetical protein